MTLRLAGINAPELATPEGPPATEHLRALLGWSGDLVIRTVKDRKEKYGRYLATIWAVDDGGWTDHASVNDLMIADGFAVAYTGGKR